MIDWNDGGQRAEALQVLLESVLMDVPAEHLAHAIVIAGHRCTVSRAEALIDGIEQPTVGEMVGLVQLAKTVAAESDRHNRIAATVFADAAVLTGGAPIFRN